jgi:hypothetical protein
MAKKKKSTSKPEEGAYADPAPEENGGHSYCSLPQVPERVFGPDVDPRRASLIAYMAKKWVNGTVLHYYFFDQETDGETVFLSDGTSEWREWTTTDEEMSVVRHGFEVWKDLGIGLEFEEADSRDEAEIRIGFMRGDGAWSYVGREILNVGPDDRTMNFGWDLTRRPDEIDTAVHEIGHTLGFPHEHQNPYAGIVWDEEAVYAELAGPPNYWDQQTTYYNIIRKIRPDTVQGSNWDSNSVMHYPFGPGMIKEPEEFRKGIFPAGGLSGRDRTWVRAFYPPLTKGDYRELRPFEAAGLAILEGEQANFVIKPEATRYYEIRTFGMSDTVMVLFEDEDGHLRYRTGDDDSGEENNASIRFKLIKDHEYVLRIRLYYRNRSGETAVMMW